MTVTNDEDNLVVHTRDMSHNDFAMHMTLRHQDSLGDLHHLDFEYMGLELGYNEGVVMAWRAFHRRLHELRIDIPHVHDQGDRHEDDWQG